MSMTLTVQNIITDAMGLIGAVAIDETPTDSELSQALRTANVMIDRWSSQRMLLRSTSTLSFAMVPGTSSYTVGPSGAAVTAAKPINLYSGFTRDSNGWDIPLEIISITQYNNLQDKISYSGDVIYVAYDPGASQQDAGKGTIYVYPPAGDAVTMFLEVDSYMTEFVAAGDTVTFEPAYYEALIYNLAVRLFRYYHAPTAVIPADISMIAANSLSTLRTMNAVSLAAGMELPGKVSSYSIYTDN